MKYFALALGLLGATDGLARPLVVYSPHGSEMLSAAQEAFAKVEKDAVIDWQFMSTEEVLNKLTAEKAKPVADIWWGGPQFTFMRGAKDELLAPYKPSWAAQSLTQFHDAKDLWYGDLLTPLTIIYQKNLTKPEDLPKDWDDLLNPALAQKLIVRFPMNSGSMRALYAALIDRQIAQGKTLDQALEWMKKLEAQVARYETHSLGVFSSVGKGLHLFSLWNLPETLLKSRQGYPVGFVYPASGMPTLVDAIALVKKPNEHPLAKKFYEFVTSREFATKLTEEPLNRVHARKDLGKGARPDYLDDPRFKTMPVDWGRVAENEALWMQRWESEVFSKGKLSH